MNPLVKQILPGRLRVLFLITVIGVLLHSGCAAEQLTEEMTPTIPSPTATLSPSPSPVNTSVPQPTPTMQPTKVASACSPLKGIALDELYAITSFEFNNPTAYSDAFHPGVDLAFFSYKEFTTMHGLPVQALLPGKVVQVIEDRFPYGNSILIETPLELVDINLKSALLLPTPIPQREIDLFSPCAKDMPRIAWSADSKSLFTLYAHLKNKPAFEIGAAVACGETIGAIGITGNSVADHLHLEMRLGPAEAHFGTFAALRPDATAEEKYNYCIWNSSGYFQGINPALFWQK